MQVEAGYAQSTAVTYGGTAYVYSSSITRVGFEFYTLKSEP